jgi:hypothetical protein
MKFEKWLKIRENWRPGDDLVGSERVTRKITLREGSFVDQQLQKTILSPAEGAEALREIGMGDSYTLEAQVAVVGQLVRSATEGQDRVRLSIDECHIYNDSNGKGMEIPDAAKLFKLENESKNAPYTVWYDWSGTADHLGQADMSIGIG